jgi:hypothetical protein
MSQVYKNPESSYYTLIGLYPYQLPLFNHIYGRSIYNHIITHVSSVIVINQCMVLM